VTRSAGGAARCRREVTSLDASSLPAPWQALRDTPATTLLTWPLLGAVVSSALLRRFGGNVGGSQRAGSASAGLSALSHVTALSARVESLEVGATAVGAALGDVARDVARTRVKLRLARRSLEHPLKGAAAALGRHEQQLQKLSGACVCVSHGFVQLREWAPCGLMHHGLCSTCRGDARSAGRGDGAE
jgi:hypothetical protein